MENGRKKSVYAKRFVIFLNIRSKTDNSKKWKSSLETKTFQQSMSRPYDPVLLGASPPVYLGSSVMRLK
jgi:hypothetical protein